MTDKTWKEWKVIQILFVANGGATWTDDAEIARNQFQACGIGLKIQKGFFLYLDIIRIIAGGRWKKRQFYSFHPGGGLQLVFQIVRGIYTLSYG